METVLAPQEKMTTMSVKEFAMSKGFISAHVAVRVNMNGYPYVTFHNKDNVSENIYFSKAAGNAVAAGTVVDGALLSKYMIGITKNAAGEERIKLVTGAARVDLLSIL